MVIKMKLDVKKTVYIGFGFLTIMMLWGVYNWFIPQFLDSFLSGLVSGDKILIGVLMALDNLFALFMIPVMSKLSDKTRTKFGRRIPYIFFGIILSAIAFSLIPLANESGSVVILILNILLVLICMNIYRSPCVSLMPDVTPKALRSKGNSVINIMGGVGTAIAYICNLFFARVNHYIPFYIVSGLMLVCLVIIIFKVHENKYVEEYHQVLKENGIDEKVDQEEEKVEGGSASTNSKNVWLALAVVFLVYMANNAVETWLSLYSEYVFTNISNVPFNLDPGTLVLIPFGVATFACAVPAALIADKIGRKTTIFFGTILMAIAYLGVGIFGYTTGFSYFQMLFFLFGGAGFAFITINIYPMVVENCSSDKVGTYTGYYYTSSMLAQSITPALSGLFMSNIIFNDMRFLFPYCVIFMIIAAVALSFIKDKKVA